MTNNALATARSPYLRQHADDPVSWRLWGPDAEREARERDVPIFLSSGYSACHWCHVMQSESFREPATARLLNDRFVPVKVDRELRPDVDALYMDYVTGSTGRGGWPMSVILAPDLSPLFGASYLPAEPRGGLPGFVEVLDEVDRVYREGGEPLERAKTASMAFLREQAAPRIAKDFDREAIDTATEYAMRLVDKTHGGFGDGPKFPQATLVQFLCTYHRYEPDSEIVWVVEHCVSSMLRGGIYDHAGGGLFRYATDAAWTLPHFEKMLYDNAQLLSTLAAASRVMQDPVHLDECERAARGTAAFMARELALPGGGYAASLSADQAGVEGGYYQWTHAQLADALTPGELDLAVEQLGADPTSPAAPRPLTRRDGRAADAEAVDAVLEKLMNVRGSRVRPEADDKLLCAWNALAARGLLDAGAAFDDEGMKTAGLEVLQLLRERCSTPSGVLRIPDDPSVADVRLIEDAALLASACLSAHETTGAAEWLEAAKELHAGALATFADGTTLYMVPETNDLPLRPREQGDEPTPSGAATVLDNAVRLSEVAGDPSYAEFARDALRSLWSLADYAPEHSGRVLEAAMRLAAIER